MTLDEPDGQKQKQHLGLKVKAKRGKATHKQKRRLAAKLDKVRGFISGNTGMAWLMHVDKQTNSLEGQGLLHYRAIKGWLCFVGQGSC